MNAASENSNTIGSLMCADHTCLSATNICLQHYKVKIIPGSEETMCGRCGKVFKANSGYVCDRNDCILKIKSTPMKVKI